MDGIGANTRIVAVTPWWQTALNVTQIVLAVLSVLALALLVADMIPSKKKKSNQKDRTGPALRKLNRSAAGSEILRRTCLTPMPAGKRQPQAGGPRKARRAGIP